MRSIADSYIDEGMNKGIAIGEARGVEKRNIEIVTRMLQEKTDINFISSVTGLSQDEITKLQNKA